jgi:hypothetical protein
VVLVEERRRRKNNNNNKEASGQAQPSHFRVVEERSSFKYKPIHPSIIIIIIIIIICCCFMKSFLLMLLGTFMSCPGQCQASSGL